jgi:hypothetical protein
MTYLFIARFLARCALTGARRCSSANLKRRAASAFTSLADSDPGHREARAGRVRQHDKLLRSKLVLLEEPVTQMVGFNLESRLAAAAPAGGPSHSVESVRVR